MKVVEVPRVSLGHVTMDAALDRAFGPDTLRLVHGPDTRAEAFGPDGLRRVTFAVDVTRVPGFVRALFCKPRLAVEATQRLDKKSDAEWEVTSDVRMRFVGAEAFRVSPRFSLTKNDEGAVFLSGSVRHDASLPPPLSWACERCMARHSRAQLQALERGLGGAGR